MDNEQLIVDLKATRTALATNGRCRADLEDFEGRVCLDGAILKGVDYPEPIVTNREDPYVYLRTDPRAVAVVAALAEHVPEIKQVIPSTARPVQKVYLYNDLPTTTDADCFNLIDKAIVEAGGMA